MSHHACVALLNFRGRRQIDQKRIGRVSSVNILQHSRHSTSYLGRRRHGPVAVSHEVSRDITARAGPYNNKNQDWDRASNGAWTHSHTVDYKLQLDTARLPRAARLALLVRSEVLLDAGARTEARGEAPAHRTAELTLTLC